MTTWFRKKLVAVLVQRCPQATAPSRSPPRRVGSESAGQGDEGEGQAGPRAPRAPPGHGQSAERASRPQTQVLKLLQRGRTGQPACDHREFTCVCVHVCVCVCARSIQGVTLLIALAMLKSFSVLRCLRTTLCEMVHLPQCSPYFGEGEQGVRSCPGGGAHLARGPGAAQPVHP